MVAKIFISYRRDDSKYQARMIYEAFCNVFPRDCVFMDIDTIPLGTNFRKILKDWVDQCEVLLALIGPGWIDASDPNTKRRRLENPSDFVRIEIGEALARKIPVVPVFIDGAPLLDTDLLPGDLRELAERQAEFVEFRTFHADVERLIRKLNVGQAVDKVTATTHSGASAKSRGQGSPRRTAGAKGGRRRPASTGDEVGTLEPDAKSRAKKNPSIGIGNDTDVAAAAGSSARIVQQPKWREEAVEQPLKPSAEDAYPPPITQELEDELWYKDAIIYQLHVKAFADSNNDGIGDFAGLTEKLGYLQDLGVTALWLMPFYPSPGRDDGYDIADYGDINPHFGTMKDFRRFITEAKKRGLRIITELVINHTSDQHDWFKRARHSAPKSPARNWYVWSDTDQKYQGTRIVFTDTEKSNWTWDPEAGQFYWHRFFSHQPDLNFDNPRVVSALVQVMRGWLDLGVDGFRFHGVPFLVEREGTTNENLPETHAVIKRIRAELDAYGPGLVLLADANQWPEDVRDYFGAGDECNMAYHFPLTPRIYMAIAQEDRFPITDIMQQTPDIPPNSQWAMFLRNHDELSLDMVTDSERDYLWSTYAPDPRARINLGIRRRLAPLMDNDRRKIELMNSLLFSFPGTPIIYYGDEIGMGDNIFLDDRDGVRTPMQWTGHTNAGFSACDPARLYLPAIMDSVYGHQAVNVEAQSRSFSSLLSATKRLIAVRKSSQAFSRGSLTFIRSANRAILVYVRQYHDEVVLCVANLSRSAQAAEIDLMPWRGWVPLEMLGRTLFPRIPDGPYTINLTPYGFFWFTLLKEPEVSAKAKSLEPTEVVTLVMGEGWRSLLEGRGRSNLEKHVLPAFLSGRRWFAEKGTPFFSATLQAGITLEGGDPGTMLALIDFRGERAASRYAVPLAVKWRRFDELSSSDNVVAAVRRYAREGTLVDVATDPEFISLLLGNIRAGHAIVAGDRRIEFRPTEAFASMPPPTAVNIREVEGEGANTTAIVDDRFVVKMFRRLQSGDHPETEIGRFLTDTVQYRNAPLFLGAMELREGDTSTTVAVAHALVQNQGDAWTVTNAYLDRFIDEQRTLARDALSGSQEIASYLHRMRHIGRRTAELQNALASRPDIPGFAPEPVTPQEVADWTRCLVDRANTTFDELSRSRSELDESARVLADRLVGTAAQTLGLIKTLLPSALQVFKIRYHGDLHLGQILLAEDDAYIAGFQGETRGSPEEPRKTPAARDVAGLTRSIDYAAMVAFERALQKWPEEHARLLDALDDWSRQSIGTFMASYRQALTNENLWPADRAEADRLLDFFLLEKALYEVNYELANRPRFLGAPLLALHRILTKSPSPFSPQG